MNQADTLISYEDRRESEKEKVRQALRNCGYPDWALKEGEQRGKTKLRGEQEPEAQLGIDQAEGKSGRTLLYYLLT